jgi:hypothetical protein
MPPSSWAKTSLTQALPHNTPSSRVITRPLAAAPTGMSSAVMSPLPTSSARAALTFCRITSGEGCNIAGISVGAGAAF